MAASSFADNDDIRVSQRNGHLMSPQTDNPEYWRFRAEEVRTIAEEMNQAEPKAIMNRIADDYERIPKFFEQSAQKQQ